MTTRRLTDYTGIVIWIVSAIFVLGKLYTQQIDNTKAIAKFEPYKTHMVEVDTDITILRIQSDYQKQRQEEFMVTFKEMVIRIGESNKEMKKSNAAILKKIQSTDDNVLRTSYQLEALKLTLQESKNSHAMETRK